MDKLLWVGIGGFTGALLRYTVGSYIQGFSSDSVFPYGTLTVNLIGCLLIGFLSHLAMSRELFSIEARLLIITGVLGSFTTFSTFGHETVQLIQNGKIYTASIHVFIHILVGLNAVWLGQKIADSIP